MARTGRVRFVSGKLIVTAALISLAALAMVASALIEELALRVGRGRAGREEAQLPAE